MLTGLGTLLSGWRPGAGGADPLAMVRAVWLDLVGADVARAAAPVAIDRDVLVVLTASAAWSHQLAFLEPEILRGLAAVREVPAFARLRFRVGTVRRPAVAAGGPGGPRRGAADSSAHPPAVTAEEALARLRRAVERSRDAHRARGGAFCGRCAAPTDRRGICGPCAGEQRARRRTACERLLFEAPWLSPEKVLALVDGLTPDEYDAIRRALLRSWWDELRRAHKLAALRRPIDRSRLRKLASSFVLLETRLEPMHLEMDSPLRKNALGELYEFVRRIETEES